jgi:hypothetical protein
VGTDAGVGLGSDPFWSLRSARLWLALLLALGVTATNLMKNNMGMALVCMMNSTARTLLLNSTARPLLFNFTTAQPQDDACSFYGSGVSLDYDVSCS